ncbi:MAG TPA: hypothetical protein VKZ78_06635 [Sphingobacteriaceae bacterium]|nr:hypothetical protein [Sphingobacteriaceae bacterium]
MKSIDISKSAHLIGHHHPVYALAMAADGKGFYSGGNDKGVVQWSLDPPGFVKVLCPVPTSVYSLHALPDGMGLLLSMRSGEVWWVSTDQGQVVRRFALHKEPVFAIGTRMGAGGQLELVVGSEDGWVSVWNLEQESEAAEQATDRGPIYHFKLSDVGIRCMALSPDGKWLCFGTKDGKISVLNSLDYSRHKVWDAHAQGTTSLCFSPDGKYLLSSGRDARFCVFRTSDFGLEKEFVPHMYAVYAIQYHPTLPVFATASRDKSVKIWSAEDFRLLRSISMDKGLDAHRFSVNALSWDHSGRYLLTTGDDKVVMIWGIEMQRE